MTHSDDLPVIIQGGMGAAVSDWRLANAVARTGQLGVVSGTVLDTVFVRRLQDGDPDGHMRRAMDEFPWRRTVEDALRRFFRPGGRGRGAPYRLLPLPKRVVDPAGQALNVLAAFVEVRLAREGHRSPIGINLLSKVQIPTIPTLYGAMLAGATYVLMGAGIPREIPAVLDRLSGHRSAELRLDVEGAPPGADDRIMFDPSAWWEAPPPDLERPRFFPIVASNSLATMFARKTNGVDGLIVEGPTAGGHNAPPRGEARHNARGEPVYGEKDAVDLTRIRDLGLPFWTAGGCGHPEALSEAQAAGATGVQVGTLFAFCDESGLSAAVKRSVLAQASTGDVDVRTEARASPTGYPFKMVQQVAGTEARGRRRVCDLGYLRTAFRTADGETDFRCPAEPVAAFVRKGGRLEDTVGRRCLCNGLLAAIGQEQVRGPGSVEAPIVTGGDDVARLGEFLRGRARYSAADVVSYLTTKSLRSQDHPQGDSHSG